jgi:hypothetical protein
MVLIMDVFRDEQGFPKNNLYKGLIFQAIVAGVCLFFSVIFDGRMVRTEALKMHDKTVHQMDPLVINESNPLGLHHYDSENTLQTLKDEEKYHHKNNEMIV